MNKNLLYRVLCIAVAKWQALRGDLVPRIQLPKDDLTDKAKAIWQHADESPVFRAMKVSCDMCSTQMAFFSDAMPEKIGEAFQAEIN
nr:hypothetical protein [uncultured Cohaesibacter sp.]